MIVCPNVDGGASPAERDAGVPSLRCGQCGGKVHLDRHHLAWYGLQAAIDLWRFWRHIPRRGRITVFDRSWYRRVLVERVEGLCLSYDWLRAYNEIVDFESQLTRNGFVVVKFWLSISKDGQLWRFKERKTTGFKRIEASLVALLRR